MRVYVVVSVYSGCIHEVHGFQTLQEARIESLRLMKELGIQLGREEESEHDVQVFEIDIDLQPMSVLLRRQVW